MSIFLLRVSGVRHTDAMRYHNQSINSHVYHRPTFGAHTTARHTSILVVGIGSIYTNKRNDETVKRARYRHIDGFISVIRVIYESI